jgi:deoxyribose-phosphate aldolase
MEENMTKEYTLAELAKLIDHTNLNPNATNTDIEKLCNEAKTYNVKIVAIGQTQTKKCAALLAGSGVLAGPAIAFPLGQTTIATKVHETEVAIAEGAGEIDYVINIGKAIDGEWDYIKEEMESIVAVCRKNNIVSKVIFENHYLNDEQKIKLCEIANEVNIDFVKTSTGTAPTGATVQDVALMRKYAKDSISVKASGQVRDADTFLAMIKAGATRIGTSSSIKILEELKEKHFANGNTTISIELG